MIKTKKNIFKPKFKSFNNKHIIIRYKDKILSFKKKKWERLKARLIRISVTKKQNCYYKFYDQQSYVVNRFTNRFSNKFKQNVINKRLFKNLFGYIRHKKIKSLLNPKKTILDKKTFNLKHVFKDKLEKKLDSTIVRSFFVSNLRSAKQLISHRHVKINNLTVKSNSVTLKVGDKINFSPAVHSLLEYNLAHNIMWPIVPKHLQISYKIFQIIVIDDSINTNISNLLEAKFDFDTLLK